MPTLIEIPSKRGQSRTSTRLGNASVDFDTQFNTTAGCWTLDVYDAQGKLLLAGLMLVPNIDLLAPYTKLAETFGALVLFEASPGDYKNIDKLGTDTFFINYLPGETVFIQK
jgi:hypothetical protein